MRDLALDRAIAALPDDQRLHLMWRLDSGDPAPLRCGGELVTRTSSGGPAGYQQAVRVRPSQFTVVHTCLSHYCRSAVHAIVRSATYIESLHAF